MELFLKKILFLLPIFTFANTWFEHLNGIKADAINEGINPSILLKAIKDVRKPSKTIKKLEKNQPEKRILFKEYRNSRIDNYRVLLGKRALKNNKDTLDKISERYYVDPEVIVSIWGIETSYGHFKGKHPVIPSLLTLAFTSPRKSFFRKELIYALKIASEGHVSLEDFVGEWAGGSGHPQFIPSSWNSYSEDFDGDGKRDIWNHKADALASIANYLKQHGWQYHKPSYTKVKLTRPGVEYDKLKTWKTVKEWKKAGVVSLNSKLPADNTLAAILKFEGGPDYLVYKNFKVIMSYNRSTFYAAAVAYLGERIIGANTV